MVRVLFASTRAFDLLAVSSESRNKKEGSRLALHFDKSSGGTSRKLWSWVAGWRAPEVEPHDVRLLYRPSPSKFAFDRRGPGFASIRKVSANIQACKARRGALIPLRKTG